MKLQRSVHARPVITACIFCGGTPLSETHIWPNWLRKVLPKQKNFIETKHTSIPNLRDRVLSKQKVKRDLFAQDPLLACVDCNGGWMKSFEDEVIKFIKPILEGTYGGPLSPAQRRVMAGWASLIVMLHEYATVHLPTVSKNELLYLKQYRVPPDYWYMFIGNCSGPHWTKRCQYHNFTAMDPAILDIPIGADGRPRKNSQIMTMGIGKLLVHTLVCPKPDVRSNFQIAAAMSGLIQLWPTRFGIWPFVESRLHFPLPAEFTDPDAYMIANEFYRRIAKPS